MAVKLRNASFQKDLSEPLIDPDAAVLLCNRRYPAAACALELHLPVIIEEIDEIVDHDL